MSTVSATQLSPSHDIVLGQKGCFRNHTGVYHATIQRWAPHYRRARPNRKRDVLEVCYKDLMDRGCRFFRPGPPGADGCPTFRPVADGADILRRMQRHLQEAVRHNEGEGGDRSSPASSPSYFAPHRGLLLLPRPELPKEVGRAALTHPFQTLPLPLPPRPKAATAPVTPAAPATEEVHLPSLPPHLEEAASSLFSLSEATVLDCFWEAGLQVDRDGDDLLSSFVGGGEDRRAAAAPPPAPILVPPQPCRRNTMWPDIYAAPDGADAVSQLTDDNYCPPDHGREEVEEEQEAREKHRTRGSPTSPFKERDDEGVGSPTAARCGGCRPHGRITETTIVTEDGRPSKPSAAGRTFQKGAATTAPTLTTAPTYRAGGACHPRLSRDRSGELPRPRRPLPIGLRCGRPRRFRDPETAADTDSTEYGDDEYCGDYVGCDIYCDDAYDLDQEEETSDRSPDRNSGGSGGLLRRLERLERRWAAGERERRHLRRRLLDLEARLLDIDHPDSTSAPPAAVPV